MRVSRILAAACAAICLLGTSHARAIEFNTVNAEMADLIAEKVAAQMLANASQLPAVPQSAGYGCGCCLDDACCYPCGWDAGVEFTYIKSFLTRDPGTQNNVQPDYEYEFSPRFYLGYMGVNGIGIRSRYFQYDEQSEFVGVPGNSLQFSAELKITDLEMTFRATKCDWCLLTSAGVRHMNFRVDEDNDGNVEFKRFQGWGPTVSIEAQRRCGCVTPFINGRASVVMGRIDNTNAAGLPQSANEPAIHTYYDAQLGLEFIKGLGCREVVVRTGIEYQYSPLLGTVAETSSDNEEDNMQWGIIGVMLRAGVTF